MKQYKTEKTEERREKDRVACRKYQARLRAEGLCISCGQVPPKEGRPRCADCIARKEEWHRKRRAARNEAGLCVRCGKYPKQANRTQCANCNTKQKFRRYGHIGLTPELLEQLGTTCMICEDTFKLSVDHCHATNTIRGLLCHGCNMGLGNFKDSALLLARATQYVLHPPVHTGVPL